jgi:hypothetical protein
MRNKTKKKEPNPSEDVGLESLPEDALQLILYKVLGHDDIFEPLEMPLGVIAEKGVQRRRNFGALAQVIISFPSLPYSASHHQRRLTPSDSCFPPPTFNSRPFHSSQVCRRWRSLMAAIPLKVRLGGMGEGPLLTRLVAARGSQVRLLEATLNCMSDRNDESHTYPPWVEQQLRGLPKTVRLRLEVLRLRACASLPTPCGTRRTCMRC